MGYTDKLIIDLQEIQQIIHDTLAKRDEICNVHGCQRLSNTSNGFCDEHRNKAYRERDQMKAYQLILERIYNISTKHVHAEVGSILETRDDATLGSNLAVLNGNPILHDTFEEFELSIKNRRSEKPHSAPACIRRYRGRK